MRSQERRIRTRVDSTDKRLSEPSKFAAVESDLTFVGIAGILDPPRVEVKAANDAIGMNSASAWEAYKEEGREDLDLITGLQIVDGLGVHPVAVENLAEVAGYIPASRLDDRCLAEILLCPAVVPELDQRNADVVPRYGITTTSQNALLVGCERFVDAADAAQLVAAAE